MVVKQRTKRIETWVLFTAEILTEALVCSLIFLVHLLHLFIGDDSVDNTDSQVVVKLNSLVFAKPFETIY